MPEIQSKILSKKAFLLPLPVNLYAPILFCCHTYLQTDSESGFKRQQPGSLFVRDLVTQTQETFKNASLGRANPKISELNAQAVNLFKRSSTFRGTEYRDMGK